MLGAAHLVAILVEDNPPTDPSVFGPAYSCFCHAAPPVVANPTATGGAAHGTPPSSPASIHGWFGDAWGDYGMPGTTYCVRLAADAALLCEDRWREQSSRAVRTRALTRSSGTELS